MSLFYVALVNWSTVLAEEEVAPVAAALKIQVNRDFALHYGIQADVRYFSRTTIIPPNFWELNIFDNSDQAGVLGYHDYAANGNPAGKVFAGTDKAYGLKWSVTASHELLEMLADPYINLVATNWVQRGQDATWWLRQHAYEVCLSGETEIQLQNGKTARMRDLEGVQSIPLISAGLNGEPRNAFGNCRLSGRNRNTLKITFGNGSEIVSTPDHRFMTEFGGWRNAADFSIGDRLKMSPPPSFSNVVNSLRADSEFSGEVNRSFLGGSNLHDLRLGKLGERMLNALVIKLQIIRHSPFFSSIANVVSLGSKKKMVRSATLGVIAAMKNRHAFWNFPVVDFVRDSVGSMNLSSVAHLAVSKGGFGTGPFPAFIRFLNPTPESFNYAGLPFGVVGGDSDVYIPVMPPPRPMSGTQSTSAKRSDTTRNGARFDHGLIIDRIEDSGNRDVYDISVPGYRNFVLANGAVAHNCDPCEDERDGYLINDVLVSDFVLPRWFNNRLTPKPGERFNFQGTIDAPLKLRPGGYIGVQDVFPATGWVYLTGSEGGTSHRAPVGSRRERRTIPSHQWKKSCPVASRTVSHPQTV